MTDDQTAPQEEQVPTGDFLGYVKWFNDGKGYGFVRVLTEGEHYGEDVFVHQSNLRPSRSTYRTLLPNECVSFNLSEEERPQALEVTGVNGRLMCDTTMYYRYTKNRRGDSSRRKNGVKVMEAEE